MHILIGKLELTEWKRQYVAPQKLVGDHIC